MTDDPLYQRLLELSWRRPLNAAEQAQLQSWLAEHPEAQAEWEAEASLNQTLELLPDAPVPSNFTARVMGAVERESAAAARAHRERGVWLWIQRWLPRVAFAGVMLGLGVFSYHQTQMLREGVALKGMAESVAAVSEVASLPSPKILSDFDTIRRLDKAPAADEELLALLLVR